VLAVSVKLACGIQRSADHGMNATTYSKNTVTWYASYDT